jgi:hypothetical protein
MQTALHFAVFSGCCSKTEVFEQLYCIRGVAEDPAAATPLAGI